MFIFSTTLSDFVSVGHIFVVSGYTPRNAQSFKIILSCGKTESSNAALVISPNFNQNKISRSASVDSSCVCEECGENPGLEPGDLFTFLILVGDDRFHVALNDSPYCTFKFQVPCEQIRALSVSGDVDSIIKANHMTSFPFQFPSIKSDCEDLALEAFIPRKFEAGDVVTVEGQTNGEFLVSFVEDESERQLLHFNVRFDEMSVVMNTMDGEEEWTSNEVRSNDFPFVANQTFKIAFGFTQNELKVAVNGNSLMTFPLSCIEVTQHDENLWEILTGIRVKNGVDAAVKISEVEFVQTGDRNVSNLEGLSGL